MKIATTHYCNEIEIFFSNKIKQLRTENKLSLEKAGNLIGIPMVELYKYENRQLLPSITTVDKIAKVYNVSIKTLCDDKEENSEIVAYKLLIRSFLKIDNYSGELITILFETIVDKQEYLKGTWIEIEAYFTKKDGEIIIEVIKKMNSLPYQTIKWEDYMKYKVAIANPEKKIKNKKEDYDSIFENYDPYSEKFENILEKYKLKVKEGEKIFLNCVGIEEALMLTKRDLNLLKNRLL